MATVNVDDWVPEEQGSAVIQRVNQMSAVETYARRIPMSSATKEEPRSGGMDVEVVSKGGTYGEDASANDLVTLATRKFGKIARLTEEDLDDITAVDVLTTKRVDWATSYSKMIDNACLGTTAATNGTTVPFTSVYKAIRTTNADTSYTADANYISAAGSVTYDNLSELLSLVEGGDYWDDSSALVIAHPKFKNVLRGIKDSQGRPIFVEGQGGDSGTPPTVFDHTARFSLGAKTSATALSAPTGNPLMIVCNSNLLYLGTRSGPEWMVARANTGSAGFTSDEDLLKLRARRGFAVAHENAFAVLELDESGS